MKAKEYDVMHMAVEEGVGYGIRHFYKHRDDSLDDDVILQLSDAVADSVMNAVCEWFDFHHEAEEE